MTRTRAPNAGPRTLRFVEHQRRTRQPIPEAAEPFAHVSASMDEICAPGTSRGAAASRAATRNNEVMLVERFHYPRSGTSKNRMRSEHIIYLALG